MIIKLLIINLILYIRVSRQEITKGFAYTDTRGTWNNDVNVFYNRGVFQIFLDIDLYPHQFVAFNFKDDYIERIDPIDEGRYFVNLDEFGDVAKSLRKTKNDIKNIPSLKFYKSGKYYKIYFDGSKIGNEVVKMFFEIIGDRKRTGIIQINVIPHIKYVEEENIFVGDSAYKISNELYYYKEVRNGVKTKLSCVSPQHKINEFKSTPYTNNETNIKYQMLKLENIDSRAIGLQSVLINLTNNVLYYLPGRKVYMFQCPKHGQVSLWDYKYEKLEGLNFTTKKTDTNYDDASKSFIIRSDTLVAMVVPEDTFEIDCLRVFKNSLGRVVQSNEFFRGSLFTEISESIKVLNLIKAGRYNSTNLYCKNRSESGPHAHFKGGPSCDITNPDNLERDGISCTIFLNYSKNKIYINKDKTLSLRENESGGKIYYLDDPESMSLESEFKPISKIDDNHFDITEKDDYLELTPLKEKKVSVGQVFILLQDKEKALKNVVRIYIHNDKEYKDMKDIKFYELVPDKKNTKFNCKDLDPSHQYKPIIYPKGKNTVFRNVVNNFDPEKNETVQFEDLFGSSGITILKSPETDSDLEIIFDDNYEITADHFRPIYFICHMTTEPSLREYEQDHHIVVSVDPLYVGVNYKGSGTRDDIFSNSSNQVKNGKIVEFDLNKEKNIRFFCPDYVPEHFLSGDQEKYKTMSLSEDTENPFKSLVRCYNRSSFISRFLKLKGEANILEKRTSVSELRSLWKFDEELMKRERISKALCVCYNKMGKAKSAMFVNI